MEKTSQNILLCCTGSGGALNLSGLITLIKKEIPGSQINLALTENSKSFLNLTELKKLDVVVHTDADQWTYWEENKKVLHMDLVKWADVMVIAPLDANTLAKLSNGICDNLVSTMARAWEIPAKKPIIISPAMNTLMWKHPVTNEQLQKLQSWGYTIINPVTKILPCGEQGIGAMAGITEIVQVLKQTANQPSS